MKKVIKFVAAALIMISSVSMMSAISGDAVYAKAHYPSFIMPKKYRGTWKNGKDRIKITKNTYQTNGYKSKLYLLNSKTNGIAFKSHVLLAYKHGKEIIIVIPQSDGWSISRKGKNLIWYSMGTTVKYHRG